MSAANWPAVRILQEKVDLQDPQPLIDFVQAMAERGLLNRHMLTALCDTSLVERRDEWERWGLLHELATTHLKSLVEQVTSSLAELSNLTTA